jgi:phage terminase large subunit-like protein
MDKNALTARAMQLKRELPHLFGQKFYNWSRAFFETLNHFAILTAANQVGKSSVQIRKVIHWATATDLWPKLWPNSPIPREFWYLYPSADIATTEFQNKWVPLFMPKRGGGVFHGATARFNEECYDPVYGWKAIYVKKKIHSVEFKNGLVLYFKTYTQNVHNLQAGTVHLIACDEELPEELYSELSFRLSAVDGYFMMVFTATRNQLLWHLAMEAKGEMEKFPQAFKIQVSMYDCQFFEDGTPGMYNEEKIKGKIADCKSELEVDRRVRGRFVSEEGRKYSAFDPTKHFIKPFTIPSNWRFYGGVDPGTGGISGHPAGMGIIAVRPDNRYGVVCAGYRADGMDTTSADILDLYIAMRGDIRCVQQVYDHAAKDFFMVASRSGEFFIKAEKSHDSGEDVVNTLFKRGALQIFDTPELRKLGVELITLKKETAKKQAKDDLIDGALRYPAMAIPWDFTFLKGVESEYSKRSSEIRRRKILTPEEFAADQIRRRRGDAEKNVPLGWEEWEEDLAAHGVYFE